MLNIQELERQWIQYKIKSYMKPVAIISSGIVLLVVVSVYFLTSKPVKQNSNADKKDQNISTHVVKNIPTNEINNTANANNDTLVLHPSLGFVENMNSKHEVYIDKEPASVIKPKPVEISPNHKNVESQPTQTTTVEQITPVVIPKVSATPTLHTQASKPTKMEIEVRNSDDDIQDVIERFKKSNNPTLGIFLAKRYYDMHNYDQAYNYALQTNQINSKIDMSWIIFSKSLVKLGKKDMAISTLKTYIKNSNSSQAITLLDEIETGRFK
jgi:hypothetical protein